MNLSALKDHYDCSPENRFQEDKNGIWETSKEEVPAFI